MYTDSLFIGLDTASALLAASDMLGMTSAKELCINWLEKHVNTESVVTVLNLAERHGCHELRDVCELYICSNFTVFKTVKRAETAPVTELSEGQLLRILVHDEVSVDTEIEVVDAIRIWESQGGEERKGGLHRFLASGAVRLPLLAYEELESLNHSMQDQT